MSFSDAIKKSVMEGFLGNDIPTSQVLTVLAVTFVIGIYIFMVYRMVNRSSMYDKSYHVAMSMLSVITAGIILAMQSSIVISLGMVGALSIVRFRTAVKDTMDLLFLFWSIGEGIICGAGLFKIAIVVAVVVTIGIFVLEMLPGNRKPYLLIINCSSSDCEDRIIELVRNNSKNYKVKSRNIKKSGCDFMLEVQTNTESTLVKEIGAQAEVVSVSLLSNEGEVRF